MFGDNKSVVDSASKPHAVLHKRHTVLSFHHAHEAIAAKILKFYHIAGNVNPADILSKHWGFAEVWSQLKTRETMEIKDEVITKDTNLTPQGEC